MATIDKTAIQPVTKKRKPYTTQSQAVPPQLAAAVVGSLTNPSSSPRDPPGVHSSDPP